MCARTAASAGVLIVACFASVARGQEPTSRSSERPALTDEQQQLVEKLVRLSEEQRPQAIENQKRVVAAIKKRPQPRARGKRGAEARKQRTNELRAARAHLKELQHKRKPFLPKLPDAREWEVGMVGVPRNHQWSVRQVLGEDEALVTYWYWIDVYPSGPITEHYGTVPRPEAKTSRLYWLKAYATKGVVTRTKIDMSNVLLHIKETKTYPTPDGSSNTTFVLELVDPAVVRAFEDAVKRGHTKQRP